MSARGVAGYGRGIEVGPVSKSIEKKTAAEALGKILHEKVTPRGGDLSIEKNISPNRNRLHILLRTLYRGTNHHVRIAGSDSGLGVEELPDLISKGGGRPGYSEDQAGGAQV